MSQYFGIIEKDALCHAEELLFIIAMALTWNRLRESHPTGIAFSDNSSHDAPSRALCAFRTAQRKSNQKRFTNSRH